MIEKGTSSVSIHLVGHKYKLKIEIIVVLPLRRNILRKNFRISSLLVKTNFRLKMYYKSIGS
jgi:hypothetical protein